jgi:ABC-type nitrate/sulfonate/bicarbonate transport system substrate-binding protein
MSLKLWYTRCPTPTAFSVALHTGLIATEFAADGIDIDTLASSSDPKIRQSHFGATAPNFFRHGGNTPPLVSRSKGADIRIVAASWNAAYRPILALPESGIRTVADLRGKRLSIPRRLKDPLDFWYATAIRGLRHALATGGLTLDDIVPVEVATGRTFIEDTRANAKAGDSLWDARFMLGHQREEAFALVRGEVDAIYSQGAMAALLDGFLDAVTVADNGAPDASGVPAGLKPNNDAPYILTASGRLIDERPDLVARLVARVLDAVDWARDHERETKSIIAIETGLAVELVDRAFSPRVHQELGIDLDDEKLAALRSQHQHLVALGMIAQPIDFDRFIDPRPLTAAHALRARRATRAVA